MTRPGMATMVESTEIWRPAPGYDGVYEVSSLGKIRSTRRMGAKGGLLKTRPNAGGYPSLVLYRRGKQVFELVHRLVCMAFHGPGHLEGKIAGHLDGNAANPAAENLRWITYTENEAHKLLHGTKARGERHGRARLTSAAVTEIKSGSEPARALADKFGVSLSTIYDVRLGRCWRHQKGGAK